MKTYSYIALVIFTALSLLPPINFIIQNPPLEYWLWMVLIAGFFGVLTLFINTNFVVRFIALASFVSCFFSAVPYLSFTAYVMIVACCYFYILCSRITHWDIIFKALQSVFILNILILFMQYINHDPLLNFGVFHMEHYGILGQHMQMASFMIIATALLLITNKLYVLATLATSLLCHSSWSFVCLAVGISIYLFSINKKIAVIFVLFFIACSTIWIIKDNKIAQNFSKSGRIAIWQRSIELSNQRPLWGWGMGTYKDIFPPLSNLKCIPWRTAHNFIIQSIFEIGYPLTGCLLFGLGWSLFQLFKKEQWLLLSGLSMIITDALVHFPDRMIQTVPLCILFFAYSRFIIRRVT